MKVQLRVYNYSVVDCSLEYIGMLGMQVNSVFSQLEYGDKVDVEICLPTEFGNMHCKIPAVITKRSFYNIGLTFAFQDKESIKQFHALLERYLLEPIYPDAESAYH